MAKKSKLLTALDAHKGRDFEAEKRKKELKIAEKRKRKRVEEEDENIGELKVPAQLQSKDEKVPLVMTELLQNRDEVSEALQSRNILLPNTNRFEFPAKVTKFLRRRPTT